MALPHKFSSEYSRSKLLLHISAVCCAVQQLVVAECVHSFLVEQYSRDLSGVSLNQDWQWSTLCVVHWQYCIVWLIVYSTNTLVDTSIKLQFYSTIVAVNIELHWALYSATLWQWNWAIAHCVVVPWQKCILVCKLVVFYQSLWPAHFTNRVTISVS